MCIVNNMLRWEKCILMVSWTDVREVLLTFKTLKVLTLKKKINIGLYTKS